MGASVPDSKYFGIPFATSGDRAVIPEASQPGGSVSYTQGFGPDYERDPASDPQAKRVPRDETNDYLFQITNAIKFLQLYGLPEWYAQDDLGNPVSYPLGARVRHAGQEWRSLVANNTSQPGTAPTQWARIDAPADGRNDIPVRGWTATPPASPTYGDRYVVAASPTGAWAGQAQKIASWQGSGWVFYTPVTGMLVNYLDVGELSMAWFDGSSWRALVLRQVLRTNMTLWVRPDGNDSNDGGANTPSRAFATIQGAWDYISTRFDTGGQTTTIALGVPGTYDGFHATPFSGQVAIQGGSAPSDNYIIRCRNANTTSEVITSAISQLDVINCVLSYTFSGATASGAEWIVGARGGGQVNVIGCRYRMNANRSGLIMNSIDSKCIIAVRGATQIQGAFLCSHFVQVLGAGVFLGGVSGQPATITLAAGQTYNQYFCQASLGGVANWTATTFAGSTSPTAIRYLVTLNGVINTNGGGANFLPGTVAGIVQTGGQYA